MQRWNWFLAADAQGKWITTDGYAEVEEEFGGILKATLRFTEETPVYHHISACVSESNQVEATVTSPLSNSPSFELSGYLFCGKSINGVDTKTIVLTDGTTIIGLCFGPRSNQKNNF